MISSSSSSEPSEPRENEEMRFAENSLLLLVVHQPRKTHLGVRSDDYLVVIALTTIIVLITQVIIGIIAIIFFSNVTWSGFAEA